MKPLLMIVFYTITPLVDHLPNAWCEQDVVHAGETRAQGQAAGAGPLPLRWVLCTRITLTLEYIANLYVINP